MDLRSSLVGLLALTLGLGACSTAPKPEGDTFITKVNYYHLQDEDFRNSAADPMIPFERKHLLHGAITGEERRAHPGVPHRGAGSSLSIRNRVHGAMIYRHARLEPTRRAIVRTRKRFASRQGRA